MPLNTLLDNKKPAGSSGFWILLSLINYQFGGAEGSRTPDLLNAIQALSQLSYSPETRRAANIAQKRVSTDFSLTPAAKLI
jgi:hypothetical protein